MYVLDFTEKPQYIAIAARGLRRVYAGPGFAHWLLDQGLVDEVSPSAARQGDLLFYFDDEGRFTHAGLWVGNQRVVSKWGIGHLYEHGLFELPESYGTNVRFFKRLPYDKAYDLFKRFAQENGVILDDTL